jgi:prepilin-type N-terminal cleavage/methylation domain-containing protein
MKLNQLKIQANEKGFTLIELMIVIAIIGILAAVAIPNFIAYRDKAFCSSAEADANSIAAGLADYFAIPSHVSMGKTIPFTVNEDGTHTGSPNFKFSPLSGANTATVGGGVSAIRINVTDSSQRCPTDYQQANPEWSNTTPGIYTKAME